MASQEEQYPSPTLLSELSALADGSVDPSRREAVEDWIAGSPHLRSLYERERAAVEALRQAAAERAPARLRLGIKAQRARRCAAPPQAGLCSTRLRYSGGGIAPPGRHARLAICLAGSRARAARTVRPRSSR
jgi:anti-sigma factor RsiW